MDYFGVDQGLFGRCSGATLGFFWGHSGWLWGRPGWFWGHSGVILGSFWNVLRSFGRVLGRSRVVLDGYWVVLDRSEVVLELVQRISRAGGLIAIRLARARPNRALTQSNSRARAVKIARVCRGRTRTRGGWSTSCAS